MDRVYNQKALKLCHKLEEHLLSYGVRNAALVRSRPNFTVTKRSSSVSRPSRDMFRP